MHSFRLLLLAFCLVQSAHAQQIYKWVDAQGRTHYSENKDDAAGAKKVDEVTVKLPPQDPRAARAAATPTARPDSKPESQAAKKTAAPVPPTTDPKPGWEYSDKNPETNESRCALARAILDGSAKRTSGRPTDQNDRNIAQNDVKAFCR
jgi:hypothetical protein